MAWNPRPPADDEIAVVLYLKGRTARRIRDVTDGPDDTGKLVEQVLQR